MTDNSWNKNLRLVLPVMCLVVLAAILVAGLRPFQFKPENAVEWLRNPDGIRFRKWGIAYSKEELAFGDKGLAVEMVVEPLRESNHSITILLKFFENRNSKWLIVGQWRSNLILRWRDDSTGGKKKYREVGVKDALLKGNRRHLVISSGKGGTSIYVDGSLRQKTNKRLPFGSDMGRGGHLTLGNFSGGDDQWYGSIYRLAIYSAQLSSGNAIKLYNRSLTGDTGYYPGGIKASYEYTFNGEKRGPGNLLINRKGTGGDIIVPDTFNIPEKTILHPPWEEFRLRLSYFSDVVINLLGFIPLGFTFALFLRRRSGLRTRTVLMVVVVFGFGTSLTIEILQAFMPSRSSSGGDLLFNTVGTVIGVVLINSYWRRFWDTKRLNKKRYDKE